MSVGGWRALLLREALLTEKQSDFLEQTLEKNFQEAMCNFKTQLEARGYPKSLTERMISEVSFTERQSALKKQIKQTEGKIMPFVTTYHPGVKNLKQILRT